METLGAAIEKDQSVGFLDNPIAWVGAQLAVAPKIEKYNAIIDNYNATSDLLTTLNSATQQVAATEQATMQTVTADSAAAASRLAGVQYLSRANEATIKALANDTAQIKFMRDSDIQKISIQADARRTIDQASELSRRNEMFELQKKQFQISMAREERLAAKERREEDFQNTMVAMANLGANQLGSRTFASVEDFKLFAQRNPEQAQKLMSIGYDISDVVTNKGGQGSIMLGSSPGDTALSLVSVRGTLKTNPMMDTFLKTAYNTAMTPVPGKEAPDPKKPETVKAAVNAVVQQRVALDSKDIRNGDTNIYRPPTWGEMIAVIGGDDKLPAFYKKVLQQEVRNNPSALVDPQVLFSRGVEAVRAGTVKFEEMVSGVQQLAKTAGETNNAIRNYASVGVPSQKSYTTQVKVHPNAMYNRTVDFYDYAALSNAAALAVATKNRTLDLPLGREAALPPSVNAAIQAREDIGAVAGQAASDWLTNALKTPATNNQGAK